MTDQSRVRMPSRRRLMLATVAAGVLASLAPPASAQFSGIVYDPTNYAQNVLTAARSLEQINNQIQMLQGQATSLINQARNLASLPYSALGDIQAQLQRTRQLIGQAQRIAYDVQSIDKAFTSQYRAADLDTSEQAMVANAEDRWENSVAGFQDALKTQATVVGHLDGTQALTERLVGSSQSATGALQAAQAGNQLIALQTQQLADLTAVVAAQGRAQALEAARTTAAEADGRERFRRFMRRSGN